MDNIGYGWTADLLDEDHGLTLEVNVDLLEEEVTASRNTDSTADAIQSLQNEVSTIKEELDNQKTEIENIKELLNKIIKILIEKRRPADVVENPSCTVRS